jgi:hypothetical protein
MHVYLGVPESPQSLEWALWRQYDDGFGIPEVDLVGPPRRFFADNSRPPPIVRANLDARHVIAAPSLAERCGSPPDAPSSESQRVLGKLSAWFLVCEDRQGRIEARKVQSLAHQASLVRYVLDATHLRKVLIGDEVGLGKTIEAGLIIQEQLARDPKLRVCYFAPARLVSNVLSEFAKLNLGFRKWSSESDADANLEHDDRVVASIHRAAHEAHFESWLETEPWDIVVADECHHLSNYDPDGHSPQRQYALIEGIAERQPRTGRLIMMSGTPHQGHPERFINLLRLLADQTDQPQQGAARVIFRTKEDVRDWDGEPLFPGREVNAPRVMDAPEAYYTWMREIHGCFQGGIAGGGAQRRAGGWRAAQALQWAASSLQAGLGYLARCAMRNGFDAENPSLRSTLERIRPYRLGAEDEDVDGLFLRIYAELGGPVQDDEPWDDDRWHPDPEELSGLLDRGVALFENHADDKWDFIFDELLLPAGRDQVVLFAQPVETVCAIARFLEHRTGTTPSLLIGSQSQSERDQAVDRFWAGETQYLVGSRAAYEGINLQCAHRLVHIDVPWNPMDLEQRVGRIHRFGSRRTVVVDTVVTRGSREADAYGTAYNRLQEIAGALAPDHGRMQMLFSRIMSLIPPSELQGVLLTRGVAGLDPGERSQIANLVDGGLAAWTRFHDEYRVNQEAIKSLDPGPAEWADLVDFLKRYTGATDLSGYSAEGFRQGDNGEIVPTTTPAIVLGVDDEGRDVAVVCEDVAGRPVRDGSGNHAEPTGLNRPHVCKELRKRAFGDGDAQVASLRIRPEHRERATELLGGEFPAFLVYASRCSIRREVDNSVTEVGRRLLCWRLGTGIDEPFPDDVAADVLRLMSLCAVRRDAADLSEYTNHVEAWESNTLSALRRPSDADRAANISHVIFPLAAVQLALP